MIFQGSIIEGFKVTLGCLPIQASLLIVLVAAVDPPQAQMKIYWVLIASHTLSLTLVVVNLLKLTERLYMALQCLNIGAMFLQNGVIIYTVQTFLNLEDLSTLTAQQLNFREWLRIEVYVLFNAKTKALRAFQAI